MNVSLTSSDFSKVTFQNVPESYGIAETVTLQFTIASDHEPNAKDWIGLYRVGWKSIKEYVMYEWISLPPGSYTPGIEVECVCTFKDGLPRNDEDFFQFCYINSHSKVCGASSPFQFLEDYDIVVIGETDSMLIVETNNIVGSSFKRSTATQQQCQPSIDELVIVKDEVERITGELMETKTILVERDSQLKDLGSEVNQLRSKLKQSEDLSIQLTEDIDHLKSELSAEKERQISIEKSFSERETEHGKMLSKFSEKELAYKEKEKQLNATVQDMQKQLCQKAQELELLKMDHSSNLSMLDIKQLTVEELTKRCSKMSAEMSQMKKLMGKEKAATAQQEQLRHHHQASSTDEKWTNHVALEKQDFAFHRNSASAELATDGVEDLIGRTAVGGESQKESSSNKVETDSCSTDQFGDNDDILRSRRTCKVCSLTFPVGTSVQIIRDHLQSHQKVCPVCNQSFELNCTQPEFEMHVSEHLADTIRFADGRKICPMCDLEFPPAWAQDQFEVHVNQHFADTLRPW